MIYLSRQGTRIGPRDMEINIPRAVASAGLTLSTIYVLTPPNVFATDPVSSASSVNFHDDSSRSPALRLTQKLNRVAQSRLTTGVAMFTTTGLAIFPLLLTLVTQPWSKADWDFVDIGSAAIVLLGCTLRVAAFRGLGAGFTFTIQTWPDQKLVKNGIYSWMRHPAYAGWYCIFLGYPLFHRKAFEFATSRLMDKVARLVNIDSMRRYGTYVAWAMMAAYTTFWWDANNKRMVMEENVLGEKFPDYKAYSTRVKRVIPYFW
jgi:protein-S-isoprenylcysteine O-methyltransferase Ste14